MLLTVRVLMSVSRRLKSLQARRFMRTFAPSTGCYIKKAPTMKRSLKRSNIGPEVF